MNQVNQMTKPKNLHFWDYEPQLADLRDEVLNGLIKKPKALSPKFFYDESGSNFFQQITELDEYYPTRIEKNILKDSGPEIAQEIGHQSVIIEYGCGSSEKIHLLLDNLKKPSAYLAIDISKEHLLQMTEELAQSYPYIQIHAICADFTETLELPVEVSIDNSKRIIFFPGSSIGNFEPSESKKFLHRIKHEVGSGAGLLIGVDLKKSAKVLNLAYNDGSGITEKFNKNLLKRINHECGANFSLDRFSHEAFYNAHYGRIEMHLKSLCHQQVKINDTTLDFHKGETIHTENSYKYSVEEFKNLAKEAGWELKKVWTDPKKWFSVQFFRAK